jgi:hypothetical protein
MLANAPAQNIVLGTANADGSFTGVTSGTSQPYPMEGFDELVFTFESVGTTSGGTLLIEEASRPYYTGTWSQITSISASSFTGTAQQCYHISPNAYGSVRVRISSAITGGGTVLVFLNRQGS